MSELLNIAQTNQYFADIATDMYRRKYSSRTISIRSPEFNSMFDEIHIASNFNYIIVSNLEIAAKMLSVFGSVISKVTLKCTDVPTIDVEKITKAINDHGAKPIIQLELDDCTDGIWNNLRTPFKNVKSLTFNGNVKTGKARLNKLFPNMRELFLKDVEIYDRSAFHHTFPYLENLLILLWEIEGFTGDDAEKMIKKNPQLKSLSLENGSVELLACAKDNLRSLENLEIVENFQDFSSEEDIVFASVKRVSLRFSPEQVPERIIFPQLNELNLRVSPELNDAWVDYIKRHGNLTKLNVDSLISGTHIAALADATHLTEVFFICSPTVNSDTIIHFIESNSKVNKINLKIVERILKDELKPRIEHEWKVTEEGIVTVLERYVRN